VFEDLVTQNVTINPSIKHKFLENITSRLKGNLLLHNKEQMLLNKCIHFPFPDYYRQLNKFFHNSLVSGRKSWSGKLFYITF